MAAVKEAAREGGEKREKTAAGLCVCAIQFKSGYPGEIFTISTHGRAERIYTRQRPPSVKSYAVSSHGRHLARTRVAAAGAERGVAVARWRQRLERALGSLHWRELARTHKRAGIAFAVGKVGRLFSRQNDSGVRCLLYFVEGFWLLWVHF